MQGGDLAAAAAAAAAGESNKSVQEEQQQEKKVSEMLGDGAGEEQAASEKSIDASSAGPVVANSSALPATSKDYGDEQEVAPIVEEVQNGSAVGEPAKEVEEDPREVATNVDEQRILEEMRAKVAELDPLSKDTDEATLRRFLRARSWKLPKAVKMFVDHQTWRRSFVPLGHIPQDQIKNELEAEKVFLQGHDKKGRSIAVIMAAKHDANKRNIDEFKRYCVFNFDTTVASNKPGEETFTVILDLKGLAYKNLDVRGWISTFDFLQAYYPERLGRLFIIHVPTIFWGAWRLVSPFVDKVTRDKIIFVEDKQLEQKLLEEIEKEQIPTVYGGTLPLVPIQNVVLPNWPPTPAADTPQSTEL